MRALVLSKVIFGFTYHQFGSCVASLSVSLTDSSHGLRQQLRFRAPMAFPVVDSEYLKDVDKARRDLRALISSRNCAAIMLRLAYCSLPPLSRSLSLSPSLYLPPSVSVCFPGKFLEKSSCRGKFDSWVSFVGGTMLARTTRRQKPAGQTGRFGTRRSTVMVLIAAWRKLSIFAVCLPVTLTKQLHFGGYISSCSNAVCGCAVIILKG